MTSEARYDMSVYVTEGIVRSASDGAQGHRVTLVSCDCADFINRKGRLVTVDGIPAVTLCKHNVELMERVGGWQRPAASEPEPKVYGGLTRGEAVTVLGSHYIAADLTDRLLAAARGADGITALVTITNGPLEAKYDSARRRYSLTIPASQPREP